MLYIEVMGDIQMQKSTIHHLLANPEWQET